MGGRWSLIAGRLPGRTDNEIKNYWNTHIKRKLISRGLDPQTHRPLNESGTGAGAALDFRNGSPPSLPVAEINLMAERARSKSMAVAQRTNKFLKEPKAETVEEANYCTSSGTTTEDDQRQEIKHEDQSQVLNLDLSIGLRPFQSRDTAQSKLVRIIPNSQFFGGALQQSPENMVSQAPVYLCCHLGLGSQGSQGSELCSNCQSTNGFYRFQRPLNS